MRQVLWYCRIFIVLVSACLPVVLVASQDVTEMPETVSASHTPTTLPTATPTQLPVTATYTPVPPTATWTYTPLPIATTVAPPTFTSTPMELSATPTSPETESIATSTQDNIISVTPVEEDEAMSGLGIGDTGQLTPIAIIPITENNPTLSPTVEQPTGSARISANIISDTPAGNGRLVTIAVNGDNLHNLYGMTLNCRTNISFFNGLQALPGDLFPPASSIRVDNGFRMDGTWAFGAYLKNPAEPISGKGTLFLMNGELRVDTEVSIECSLVLASRNGEDIPVESSILTIVLNRGHRLQRSTSQPITPPRPPTSIPKPTIEPTSTLSVLPTYDSSNVTIAATSETSEIPTVKPTSPSIDVALAPPIDPVITLAPTAESVPLLEASQSDNDMSNTLHIEGFIANSIGLNGVTITIFGENTQGQISLARSNSYQFSVDLEPGTYTFDISSNHHLSQQLTITIVDESFMLPLVTLLNGDINEDGVIDLVDGTLLSASYGLDNHLPNADLNEDGLVDIFDMAIFSGNFGERAN